VVGVRHDEQNRLKRNLEGGIVEKHDENPYTCATGAMENGILTSAAASKSSIVTRPCKKIGHESSVQSAKSIDLDDAKKEAIVAVQLARF
jgi:hypothetical protein